MDGGSVGAGVVWSSLPDTFMRVFERQRADDEGIAHLERKRRKGESDRPNKQNP